MIEYIAYTMIAVGGAGLLYELIRYLSAKKRTQDGAKKESAKKTVRLTGYAQ